MAAIPPGVDPWTIPCGPPPEGVEPNFNKRSPLMDLTIVIVVLVLSSMATTITLRFWVMHRSREPWKMDDWFTIGTFALTVAQGILQCFQTENLGFDAWDLPLGRLMSSQTHHMFIVTTVVGPLMLFAGKCCILAFYYRIFAHVKHVRCEIYGALFLSLSLVISAIVMPIYMGPSAWKGPSPTGTISGQLTLAVGVIKFVVDLVIFYIPIPVVIGLNLSTKKKMGVLTTFLTGSIAIVADIIDLYFRVEASKGKRPFIYSIYFPLCSLVEAGISVIVASMPSAAKVWRRHIVGSCVYNIVRSKFPESKTPTVHQLPTDLQVAKKKAANMRRFGLYSIPTFTTTQQDTAQTLTATTQQHQAHVAEKSTDEHTVQEFYTTSDEKRSNGLDSSSRTTNDADHV